MWLARGCGEGGCGPRGVVACSAQLVAAGPRGGDPSMKTPKIPKQSAPAPPPPPPSIDEAAKNAEEADRLRRRKGRLAGVLSNRMRAERTAGGKSLTGQ